MFETILCELAKPIKAKQDPLKVEMKIVRTANQR